MQSMQEKLEQLLPRRRSEAYYANILGITVEEVRELKRRIRARGSVSGFPHQGFGKVESGRRENLTKGELEVNTFYDHPPTAEEILQDHNMENKGYRLSQYYTKAKSNGWLVTALFTAIPKKELTESKLIEFLKTYVPPKVQIQSSRPNKARLHRQPPATLLLNKQDAHLNKSCFIRDLSLEDNMQLYYSKVERLLLKATSYAELDKIVYVIGSDHFNSEFTGTTVKGTPQTNTDSYYKSFQNIVDHEFQMIQLLRLHANEVEVVYLGGNHDQYVSWHMVLLLEALCQSVPRVSFNTDVQYTKYMTIYDAAICLNHGDVQKPERLAQNFPTAFRKGFAMSNFWYIFTGDKHTELSKQFGGIKFYQLPAQSRAISDWDAKNGYTESIPEIQAFLFEPDQGLSMILKEALR